MMWRFIRQEIADMRPAWTMDYIDHMTWQEVNDLFAYADGKAKAQEFKAK